MSTAPFDPSVRELITGVHTCGVSAEAVVPGFGTVPLSVTGGRIGWSERRAPRVTADLEVSTPTDSALIAAMDPRQRIRVLIRAAYTLANGAVDSQVVADLHLRQRTLSRPDSTMRLSLASSEALIIDSAPSPGTFGGGDGTEPDSVTIPDGPDRIRLQIRDGLWNLEYPTGPAFVITAASEPAEIALGGRDDWDDIVVHIADQLDLDVYDAGDRVIRIAPRPTVASASVLEVKGGPGGVLLQSDSTINRDDFANFVILRYDWTNSAGVREDLVASARVDAGSPYNPDTTGYKIVVEDRNIATTQAAADRAAKNLLARMLSRSRGLSLTTVPAWWVRPGHTITYTPENGPQQRHLVAEVEYDLAGMTMRVVTRLPDTDSVLGE